MSNRFSAGAGVYLWRYPEKYMRLNSMVLMLLQINDWGVGGAQHIPCGGLRLHRGEYAFQWEQTILEQLPYGFKTGTSNIHDAKVAVEVAMHLTQGKLKEQPL